MPTQAEYDDLVKAALAWHRVDIAAPTNQELDAVYKALEPFREKKARVGNVSVLMDNTGNITYRSKSGHVNPWMKMVELTDPVKAALYEAGVEYE